MSGPSDRIRGGLRRLYTDHLREYLAHAIGQHRTLTRRDLVESTPAYVTDVTFVDERETVTLSPPLSLGPLPQAVREKVGEWTFDRPFVATLRDVQLVGPHALPIASDGAYVLEATDGSSARAADEVVRTLAARRLPVRRGSPDSTLATAVSLAGPWSREFFHWFADYLPRLRSLERHVEETGAEPPLLLPADPPTWIAESLDLLGIPERRRLSWQGGRVAVRRLVVPSLPRHVESTAPDAGYIQSPRALAWVAERLWEGIGDRLRETAEDRPDVGRRLYVSRAGQSARSVVNETELRSTLVNYDFEVVHPEEWSLTEQIVAFAAADVVCGPHGGGLTNVIHTPRDATLLELFGARTNPCFYAIASGLGRRYAAYQATAEGDHLRIDPGQLTDLLAHALNQSSADSK